jgi:hypothetical protein
VIDEADLCDWKTGDAVIKRTYIQSPEVKAIAAQDAEFQKILLHIDKGRKRTGK